MDPLHIIEAPTADAQNVEDKWRSPREIFYELSVLRLGNHPTTVAIEYVQILTLRGGKGDGKVDVQREERYGIMASGEITLVLTSSVLRPQIQAIFLTYYVCSKAATGQFL